MDAETADESDDEAGGDGYYTAKASKKKDKKRQEREAQRQVWIFDFDYFVGPHRHLLLLPLCDHLLFWQILHILSFDLFHVDTKKCIVLLQIPFIFFFWVPCAISNITF